MKKILYAWIEQILQFPTKADYDLFIRDLQNSRKKFKIISCSTDQPEGITAVIRKQYNENDFPDEERK